MAEFETDEQQLESIRAWWRENGRSIIIGVVLGLGAVGGWRGWLGYQQSHGEEASVLYQSVLESLNADENADIGGTTDTLIADYSDTPYAELASLAAARVAVVTEDFDTAMSRLEWVRDNARQHDLRTIAALRLTRVLLARSDYDAAQSILDGEFPEAFSASVHELRGDLYLARGELGRARDSYSEALAAPFSSVDRELLQMKFNNIASEPSSDS